jgi:alpha-L-arabinofuranosidase
LKNQTKAWKMRQTAEGENIRAIAGDPTWTDYPLTLKARKLGGGEGFLVMFHTSDIDNPTWWNIGGWRRSGGRSCARLD